MHRRAALAAITAVCLPIAHAAAEPSKPSPPTYNMVRCIDALPGKADEYKSFVLETTSKSMQVRADEGNLAGWVFARSVIPSGRDVNCDFMQVNVQSGFPPERTPIDPYFVKAKVNITRAEWYAKLGQQSKLARLEMWRGVDELGRIEKGQYFRVDYFKIPANKKKDWNRLARAEMKRAKAAAMRSGEIKAWQAQEIVLPSGSGYPYSARIIEAYPSWDNIGIALEQATKATGGGAAEGHELVRSELYQVIDVVWPSASQAAAPPPAN
jgi:hypothetical protein